VDVVTILIPIFLAMTGAIVVALAYAVVTLVLVIERLSHERQNIFDRREGVIGRAASESPLFEPERSYGWPHRAWPRSAFGAKPSFDGRSGMVRFLSQMRPSAMTDYCVKADFRRGRD
jgi:hypothetical protein